MSYKYLKLLKDKLKEIQEFDNIVGCISLGTKMLLENECLQIESDLGINGFDIALYGRDELMLLKESPFDEAV